MGRRRRSCGGRNVGPGGGTFPGNLMVGYSATRHSSGGWNPGAQRAAGRLGERVLSHPSFQRRLESRRASARWGGWGRGYSATRHSSGGWNPGAQRAVGRLGERVLSHPSFQRRLESRRAARGGAVGGEGTQPPVIPAEAGIQARSARRGGWGRGYSATRHSSGGWNPGAQARGGAVGGEGTQPPVIPAEAGIQARKRAVGRLGERVLSHPLFQRRLESRRASARWDDWEVRVLREWGAGCVPGLLNATSVACRPHWIPASAGMTRHRAGAARSAMGRTPPQSVPTPALTRGRCAGRKSVAC